MPKNPGKNHRLQVTTGPVPPPILDVEWRSDVSQLLQNLALQQPTIWEAYAELAENGGEYQELDFNDNPIHKPRIEITHTRKNSRVKDLIEITVADNGRGMDFHDFQRFFNLGNVNLDRERGRKGVRGNFGIGAKTAAYNLADEFQIVSVKRDKDGHKWEYSIECRFSDLKRTKKLPTGSVSPRPLRDTTPTGTKFIFRSVRPEVWAPRQDVIIRGFSKKLGRKLQFWDVIWDGHQLPYLEPPIDENVSWPAFRSTDPRFQVMFPELVPMVGEVTLVIKKAKRQLVGEEDKPLRGIDFSSHNNILETGYLGNHQGNPDAFYLFGHIDVPMLEEPVPGHEKVKAYTSDRQRLNSHNLRVQALKDWVDFIIDGAVEKIAQDRKTRAEIVKNEQVQRATDAIVKTMDRYVKLKNVVIKPSRPRAGSGLESNEPLEAGSVDTGTDDEEEYILVREPDGELRWRPVRENEDPNVEIHGRKMGRRRKGSTEPRPRTGAVEEPGAPNGATQKPVHRGKRIARAFAQGGFSLEVTSMSDDLYLAVFETTTATLAVNLDHSYLRMIREKESEKSFAFRYAIGAVAMHEFAAYLTAKKVTDRELSGDNYELTRESERKFASELCALYRTVLDEEFARTKPTPEDATPIDAAPPTVEPGATAPTAGPPA